MKGRFLVGANKDTVKGNIYADKSSLVLDWLLQKGISKENFSLREVVKETGVSLGLVQRIFNILASKGFLKIDGIRTAKRFSLNKSKELLESWLDHYSIVKQCKIRTYASALSGKLAWLKAIEKHGLNDKVVLAIHSAAEAHGYKNTNLEGLELYLLNPSTRTKVEKALQLEPQEKGYEILLIDPYYKQLLKHNIYRNNLKNREFSKEHPQNFCPEEKTIAERQGSSEDQNFEGNATKEKTDSSGCFGIKNNQEIGVCPLLLTFLDLYHFPLRGQEQAEFMMQRAPAIKRIYKGRKK